MTLQPHLQPQWQHICALADLPPNLGMCAQLGRHQVALFHLTNGAVYAIDNCDPITGANVLSRGLIAEKDGKFTLCSPLLKQHYCLESGQCLQDERVFVAVYPVKVVEQQIYLTHA